MSSDSSLKIATTRMKTKKSACVDTTPEDVEGTKSPTMSDGFESPRSDCPICLTRIENKAFTDSCFHEFCFICLVEWSKVKAVCPLCKQSFRSVIHNVKSNQEFDTYQLTPSDNGSFGDENGQRFRYRSTMVNSRRRAAETLSNLRDAISQPLQILPRTSFRKRVYTKHLRVSSVCQMSGRSARSRIVSPKFFTRNPACTHRLVPWLNRELRVLLGSDVQRVQFLLQLIINLVKKYPIQSSHFQEHLRPYLQRRTEHFSHEFYHFARSPYDMNDYDQYAVYGASPSPDSITTTDENTDDDLHIVRNNLLSGVLRPTLPTTTLQTPNVVSISNFENRYDMSYTGWEEDEAGPSRQQFASDVSIIDVSLSEAATRSDSSDSDVVFVRQEKPWDKRSPVLVLSSSGEVTSEENTMKRKRHRPSHKHGHGKRKRHREGKLTSEKRNRSRARCKECCQTKIKRHSICSKSCRHHGSKSRCIHTKFCSLCCSASGEFRGYSSSDSSASTDIDQSGAASSRHFSKSAIQHTKQKHKLLYKLPSSSNRHAHCCCWPRNGSGKRSNISLIEGYRTCEKLTEKHTGLKLKSVVHVVPNSTTVEPRRSVFDSPMSKGVKRSAGMSDSDLEILQEKPTVDARPTSPESDDNNDIIHLVDVAPSDNPAATCSKIFAVSDLVALKNSQGIEKRDEVKFLSKEVKKNDDYFRSDDSDHESVIEISGNGAKCNKDTSNSNSVEIVCDTSDDSVASVAICSNRRRNIKNGTSTKYGEVSEDDSKIKLQSDTDASKSEGIDMSYTGKGKCSTSKFASKKFKNNIEKS